MFWVDNWVVELKFNWFPHFVIRYTIITSPANALQLQVMCRRPSQNLQVIVMVRNDLVIYCFAEFALFPLCDYIKCIHYNFTFMNSLWKSWYYKCSVICPSHNITLLNWNRLILSVLTNSTHYSIIFVMYE